MIGRLNIDPIIGIFLAKDKTTGKKSLHKNICYYSSYNAHFLIVKHTQIN